jgi:transposase
MSGTRYIGMDVHISSLVVAVMDERGKVVMESILETKAAAILAFIRSVPGSLHVTLEEGAYSTWLYDLLLPHVAKVVVCDPRKNALLKVGNKNDKIDARKLAELLRGGMLSPVYHARRTSLRTLQELARSYRALTQDTTRVMSRLKAAYRGWGIACGGQQVYAPRYREAWLKRLREAGVRRRAEQLYEQFDFLRALHRRVRRELLVESRKHPASEWLSLPSLGPLRVAQLIALMQTPHRFRSKRQLWAYSGLALETHSSAEYCFVAGRVQRSKKVLSLRGLNVNHNHDLKNIFKSAATAASVRSGPWRDFYAGLLAKGMKPEMARLTLARKIAAITLALWKKGERFDATQLKPQAA